MQLLDEVDQGRCKCYKPWLKAEDDNACRAVGWSGCLDAPVRGCCLFLLSGLLFVYDFKNVRDWKDQEDENSMHISLNFLSSKPAQTAEVF